MADSLKLDSLSLDQLLEMQVDLKELRNLQGYLTLCQHFSDLESRNQRLLEAETVVPQVYRLQGQVKGIRECYNSLNELLRLINLRLEGKTDERTSDAGIGHDRGDGAVVSGTYTPEVE